MPRSEADPHMEALQRSEARRRLLVGLVQMVSSTRNLRQVFGRAAREAQRLTGCDRVSLLLFDAAATHHGYALEFGGAPRWVELPSAPVEGSSAAWALEHRRPRLVERPDGESFPEDHNLFEQGYRRHIELPLVCHGAVVGVLGLAARREGPAWDVEFLEEVAAVLATAVDNAAAYTQVAELKVRLERENVYLRDELRTGHDTGLVGGLEAVREAIGQVAPTDSTVLILGETGTGKELVARAVHEHSRRRDRLLVKVNCAALAPGVITSELFGHEAGAFTGASKRRVGRFELAHQGTIFLDEIAEVPPETQVLLLRVLQDRVVERVGGNEPVPVDVRVIAATNRDLSEAVREGSFRQDLFYRLNVFPVRLPPLRGRRDDIPGLIDHFIARFSRRMGKRVERVEPRTLELLVRYDWPGNVRELEHLIERAVIVSRGEVLEVDPTWLSGPPPADGRGPLADVERRTILEALGRCGGRIYGPGGAAAALGLKPTTLYGKMRKHQIRKQPGGTRYE